jgi:hypothetical protein
VTTSLAIRTRPHQEPAGRTVIGAVPLVRVRRPPPFEPPYDDEVVSTDGTWDFLPGFGPGSSPDPDPAPDERPAAGAHRAPAESDEPSALPAERPAAPGDGAPSRAIAGRHAAHRYVGLCLEVLEGFRPVGHLRRFTVPAAFESVAHQLSRPVARAGHPPSGEVAGRLDAAAQSRHPAGAAGRPGPTAADGPRAVPRGRAGVAGGTGRTGAPSGTPQPQAGIAGSTRRTAAPGGTFQPQTGIAGTTRQTGAPGGTPQPQTGIAGTTRRTAAPGGTSQPQTGIAGGTGQPQTGAARSAAPGGTPRPQAGIAGGARPGTGQPQVTARATLPGPSAGRISLRRIRVAEPREGAVEAVAVLSRAERTWALALRLECRDGNWLCTHVEVV